MKLFILTTHGVVITTKKRLALLLVLAAVVQTAAAVPASGSSLEALSRGLLGTAIAAVFFFALHRVRRLKFFRTLKDV